MSNKYMILDGLDLDHMPLDQLKEAHAELGRRIAKQEREAELQRYHDLIVLHRITVDQIERPAPRFGHYREFASWCDANSSKRFREWNGGVYFAGDRDIKDRLCDFDMLSATA